MPDGFGGSQIAQDIAEKVKEAAEKARAESVTTLEGELPPGSARVDLAPTFLKEGREGLAGLLSFFLGQAAQPGGQRAGAIPPELLLSLFGIPMGGNGGDVGGDGGDVGRRARKTFPPGVGDGGRRNGDEEDEKILIPDLPILPTLSGLPGFMEDGGLGPNPAGAVIAGIGGGLQAANALKGLLSGGPKQPAQTVGGGGGITPIFPDINQQQLQLFLQLLQQLNTGGPAAALGPNPHTADVAIDGQADPSLPGGGQIGLLPGSVDTAIPRPSPPGAVIPEPGVPAPVVPGGPPPIEDTLGFPGTPIPEPVIPEPPPVEQIPLAGDVSGSRGIPGKGDLAFTGMTTDIGPGDPIDLIEGMRPRPEDGGIDVDASDQVLKDLLGSFLGQTETGNTFQDFAQFFSLPTFEGPFTTPATDLQRQALGASSEFLGTDLGERNQTAQDALEELIRTGGEGAPGVDPLSALTRETAGEAPLTDIAQTGGGRLDVDPLSALTRETGAEPTLEEFLTTGGGRFDLSPQFSALEAINRRRLDEQRAALNEQFGVLGARFGTDIARGQGELSSRFLEQEAAQRAEIAGQSFREQQERRLASLGLASGRDISREQIGLAGRGQELERTGLEQAGFQAQQARQLQAALGLSDRDFQQMQLALSGRGQELQQQALIQDAFGQEQARRLQGLGLGEEARRTDIAGREQRGREITEGFRLGEAERQIGDTAVQRQMAEFARTQGSLLPLLLQFFSQGVGPEEIVLPPE